MRRLWRGSWFGPPQCVRPGRHGRGDIRLIWHAVGWAFHRAGIRRGAIYAWRANDRSQVFQRLDNGPSFNSPSPKGQRSAEHLPLLRPWWFPVRPPGGRWSLGCPVPGNEFPGYQRAPSGRSARPNSDAARGLAGVGCHGQAQPCVQWPSSTLDSMAKHNRAFHGQARPWVLMPTFDALGAMAKLNGVERRHGNTVRLHRLLTPGPVDRRSGPFARAPTPGNSTVGPMHGRGQAEPSGRNEVTVPLYLSGRNEVTVPLYLSLSLCPGPRSWPRSRTSRWSWSSGGPATSSSS